MKKVTATCTWGDGPDVLLVVGTDPHHWADLTSAQAKSLAYELLNAASHADELERIAADQDAQSPA
jgi:prephenate dehydrogenase